MSDNDLGLIFAKLLVVENEIKNMTKNFEDHNQAALKRQEDYHQSLDVVIKKIECQNKRCFDHAPIIDGFEKHLESHEEIKKLSGARNFAIFIAMGGWALGLTSIVVNFLRQ